MPPTDEEPLINPNRSLQDYYASLESRIGYRLVLGGTRHFGYYDTDTYWPFPINGALRAMEDHLFNTLSLEAGAKVLDAGCGTGDVAIHMATKGLQVQGIDVVDRHIKKAIRNVNSRGFADKIRVQKGDYHHLDQFADESFDGAYTLETFVHATDPEEALGEFFRVLKPGGSLALYEYDHSDRATVPAEVKMRLSQINTHAAMPANDQFDEGVLENMLKETGFVDIKVDDISRHTWPMLRLFFLLAYIPYLIFKLFGIQSWFPNTLSGVEAYRVRDYVRYVAVSARKPVEFKSTSETIRPRSRVV